MFKRELLLKCKSHYLSVVFWSTAGCCNQHATIQCNTASMISKDWRVKTDGRNAINPRNQNFASGQKMSARSHEFAPWTNRKLHGLEVTFCVSCASYCYTFWPTKCRLTIVTNSVFYSSNKNNSKQRQKQNHPTPAHSSSVPFLN